MDQRVKRQAQEKIRLDGEGNWFQGEYPILHERTVQFLYKNIARNEEGNYFLTGEDKPIYFDVEDIPYWIVKIERTIVGYLLTLTDGSIELLNGDFLWRGKQDALYCLVKGGQFGAKFSRASYYEIAKDLQQIGSKYYLVLGRNKYPIADKAPAILTEKPAKKKLVSKKSAKKSTKRTKPAKAKKKAVKKRPKKTVKKAKAHKSLKKAAKKKKKK